LIARAAGGNLTSLVAKRCQNGGGDRNDEIGCAFKSGIELTRQDTMRFHPIFSSFGQKSSSFGQKRAQTQLNISFISTTRKKHLKL
jgi:hypothetical protein